MKQQTHNLLYTVVPLLLLMLPQIAESQTRIIDMHIHSYTLHRINR